MKKSKSIQILKQQGIIKFIKYKLNKIIDKYIKKINKLYEYILLIFLIYFKKTPFKKPYKFILQTYAVSAHWALKEFLTYSGNLQNFLLYHDRHINLNNCKNNDYYVEFRYWLDYKPLYFFINKLLIHKTPILILTRDPISRLKTGINHGDSKEELDGVRSVNKTFNLQDNLNISLDRIRFENKNGYNINQKIPSLDSIYYMINVKLNFKYFSNMKYIKSKDILYIDAKELSPKNAFNTIKKLSNKLKFTSPSESDKQKYENILWNEFAWFLPYRLLIDNDILIVVADENRVFLDNDENYTYIKENLIDIKKYLVDDKNKLFDKISINIQTSNWQIIQNNEILIDKLKKYFKEFMIVLEEKVNERKNNLVTEEDVLNFLKEHKI